MLWCKIISRRCKYSSICRHGNYLNRSLADRPEVGPYEENVRPFADMEFIQIDRWRTAEDVGPYEENARPFEDMGFNLCNASWVLSCKAFSIPAGRNLRSKLRRHATLVRTPGESSLRSFLSRKRPLLPASPPHPRIPPHPLRSHSSIL